MDIERTITISAPVDHVWDIIGTRFHEVGTWVAGINTSAALPKASGTTNVHDRVCHTPQGVFKERLKSFDDEHRTLSYIAYEGLPGFVKEGGNTWWVQSIGPGRTEVRFRMKFDLNPVANVLMGWMLKRQMSRVADEVANDLKIYAETGGVSEAKRAAQAKFASKRAA